MYTIRYVVSHGTFSIYMYLDHLEKEHLSFVLMHVITLCVFVMEN